MGTETRHRICLFADDLSSEAQVAASRTALRAMNADGRAHSLQVRS